MDEMCSSINNDYAIKYVRFSTPENLLYFIKYINGEKNLWKWILEPETQSKENVPRDMNRGN